MAAVLGSGSTIAKHPVSAVAYNHPMLKPSRHALIALECTPVGRLALGYFFSVTPP